jgi:hypothetical protein
VSALRRDASVVTSAGELEVVWPLHRWHYLSVTSDHPLLPDPRMVNMAGVDESLSLPLVVTPGRVLAARALLAGPDASQQRVSDLLGVSRRTIGRMADADCTTALHDRRCSRGRGRVWPRPPAAAAPSRNARRRSRGSKTPLATSPRSRGCRRHADAPPHADKGRCVAPAAPASAAAHSASQRAHRLPARGRAAARLTMGDALAELLADIIEAARTIGTPLQQVGNGRPPR